MYNPLESYRRTQRELRRNFAAFTRAHCAACPTPCCRKPARILPTDILLAEATGWKSRVIPLEIRGQKQESDAGVFADSVSDAAGRYAISLHDAPPTAEAEPTAPPCDFLGEGGCTFPEDLRPFGCATYICRYMHLSMDRPTLTRIKRLARELETHHDALLRHNHDLKRRNRSEE